MSVLKTIEHALFPCMRKLDRLMECEDAKARLRDRVQHNKKTLMEALDAATTARVRVPHKGA